MADATFPFDGGLWLFSAATPDDPSAAAIMAMAAAVLIGLFVVTCLSPT
jgi:hypothetical protein